MDGSGALTGMAAFRAGVGAVLRQEALPPQVATTLGLSPGVFDANAARAAMVRLLFNPEMPPATMLWTQSPTTGLPRPGFKNPDETSLVALVLTPYQAQAFLTESSDLTQEDAIQYRRFVLDRVEPHLGLLELFVLSPDIRTLQAALEFFAEQFSNGDCLETRIRVCALSPDRAHPGEVIAPTLRDLMNRAYQDAAEFLFDLGALSSREGKIAKAAARFDPRKIAKRTQYGLDTLDKVRVNYPELSDAALIELYRQALEQRLMTQQLLRDTTADEPERKVPFLIEGAGLEMEGLMTALAYTDAVGPGNVKAAGHYRSGALVKGLVEAQGYGEFGRDSMRQALTRATDPRGRGVDMAGHPDYPDLGIYRVLSPLAMDISFALGGALHDQLVKRDGPRRIFYAELGDASMSTNEFYEFLEGASVRELPVILNVLDNGVGISVRPEDGRGTVDLWSLATSKGFEFLTIDGNDPLAVYQVHRQAAQLALEGKRVLIWTQNLPRINDHSSSSGRAYRSQELDPLEQLGQALAKRGILSESEIMKRRADADRADSFVTLFELGTIGTGLQARVQADFEQVWREPMTEVADVITHAMPPLPVIDARRRPGPDKTNILFGVAIRSALRSLLSRHPASFLWGQDVAQPKGGVFQATASLSHLFADRVFNAPINEGLIAAMAGGFAQEPGSLAVFEIQFDDYARNIIHRLEQMGLLHWLSAGKRSASVIMRVATESVPAGAIYHSMSGVNVFTSIPGLVVVSPSTSRDAHGLLLTAAQYGGTSVFLEPKILYREALGEGFPGEEKFSDVEIRAMANMGWTPEIDNDPIPFGQAVIRRTADHPSAGKTPLTIVSWGAGVRTVLEGAEALSQEGIEAEVIDLRTLMPWDQETVLTSVHKTGALLVAHNGSIQVGLADHIVSRVMEAFQDEELATGAALGRDLRFGILGWDERVPGMPQRPKTNLELSLNPARVVRRAREVVGAASYQSGFRVMGRGGDYQVVKI